MVTDAIRAWTAAYEAWLAAQVPFVVAEALEKKHRHMAEAPFVFLRATYYAWARWWPAALPELDQAPRVTAVGDVHLENFGTWRDAEGRLAWGVNDFDEASLLPYTHDLVRLATSMALAYEDRRIRTPGDALAQSFLEGYRECLERGGRAVILGEERKQLRRHLLQDLVRAIGEKKRKGKKQKKREPPPPPDDCRRALEEAMPAGTAGVEVQPRVAGVGSLGRPRFLATGQWNGGAVMREAKAAVPSAVVWAGGAGGDEGQAFDLLLARSVRSADPFLHRQGRWVVRRLAADTEKMEFKLDALPRALEVELAGLMGRELANVHRATPALTASILADLSARAADWLLDATATMAALTRESHRSWKKAWKAERGR